MLMAFLKLSSKLAMAARVSIVSSVTEFRTEYSNLLDPVHEFTA
jgi:hypothetical protein